MNLIAEESIQNSTEFFKITMIVLNTITYTQNTGSPKKDSPCFKTVY